MSEDLEPPKPLSKPPALRLSLYKQKSWSPDTYRDEIWSRKKDNYTRKNRQTKSLTDDDFEELKACIELGFGFDSPKAELDKKLSVTLPALGFYHAVNKQYLERSSSSGSEISGSFHMDSLTSIFDAGESTNPKVVKTRLKQWAQVVSCSVRQSW